MNKLLKYISVIVVVLCAGYQSYGQGRFMPRFERRPGFNASQNPERRVENVKVNFIRRRLNLPSGQARKFFPLYQEYQQELFNIRKLKRQNSLNTANGTEQINKELFYENQIVKIKMTFNDAFLKVLSPDKVSELYKAEREFNDELVRSLSERSARAGN
jgi:hypothetical protein